MAQQTESSVTLRRIRHVQFGILSPEEIKRMSGNILKIKKRNFHQ